MVTGGSFRVEGPRHAIGRHPARHEANGGGIMTFLSRRSGPTIATVQLRERSRVRQPLCCVRVGEDDQRHRPRSTQRPRRRARVRRQPRVRILHHLDLARRQLRVRPAPPERREDIDAVARAERPRRGTPAGITTARNPAGTSAAIGPVCGAASRDAVTISPSTIAAVSRSCQRSRTCRRSLLVGDTRLGSIPRARRSPRAPFRGQDRSRPLRRATRRRRPSAARPTRSWYPRTITNVERAEQNGQRHEDLGGERPSPSEHDREGSHTRRTCTTVTVVTFRAGSAGHVTRRARDPSSATGGGFAPGTPRAPPARRSIGTASSMRSPSALASPSVLNVSSTDTNSGSPVTDLEPCAVEGRRAGARAFVGSVGDRRRTADRGAARCSR